MIKTIWGSLLIFFLSLNAFAQRNTAREIDKYIRPLTTKQHFSGVILASQNNQIIYHKAFGFANAEFKVPNQINTRFSIASVTKSMTRIIAIRLLEERKFDLQDKLSKFIAYFPNGDQITVEMLIRHRSGIPHRVTKPEEETLPYTPAEMVEKAKLSPLVFTPGSARLYSSTGYSVLARVLEIVSGKTYTQLLEEYIFTPSSMINSVNYRGEQILPRRSQEYLLEANGIVHAPLKDYSFLVGAGSVFATSNDIYKFGNSVLDGVFGDSVKQSLQDSEGVYSDNGNTNGFRCFLRIDRKKKFGLTVISNLESGANDLIIRDLQFILEGKPVDLPLAPNPILMTTVQNNLHDFKGIYKLGNSEFNIFVQNEKLFAGRFKLFPIGIDTFFNFGGYAELKFKRDISGKVTELEWSSPTGKSTWKRN